MDIAKPRTTIISASFCRDHTREGSNYQIPKSVRTIEKREGRSQEVNNLQV